MIKIFLHMKIHSWPIDLINYVLSLSFEKQAKSNFSVIDLQHQVPTFELMYRYFKAYSHWHNDNWTSLKESLMNSSIVQFKSSHLVLSLILPVSLIKAIILQLPIWVNYAWKKSRFYQINFGCYSNSKSEIWSSAVA